MAYAHDRKVGRFVDDASLRCGDVATVNHAATSFRTNQQSALVDRQFKRAGAALIAAS